MRCPYLHNLCGKCGRPVCRAYFPERQPYIKDDTLPICKSGNHEKECLIYLDGVKWHEERRKKSLKLHCPFASNEICGKPWLWICKGCGSYFPLTEIEEDTRGIPIRGADGNVIFKEGHAVKDIKETCLSGDLAIYEACPNYVMGMEFREVAKKLKNPKSE